MAFRILWLSSTAAELTGQLVSVAVLFQVWQLTRSSLWVGGVGLALAATTISSGLLGGHLADRLDRRRLVLSGSSGAAVAALLLLLYAQGAPVQPAWLVGLACLQNSFHSFGSPARRTFISRVLAGQQVAAGVALQHIGFQVGLLIGPAAGGLLLAGVGPEACYVVDLFVLSGATLALRKLPYSDASRGRAAADTEKSPAQWMTLLHRPALRLALLTDLAATVLAMPVALFPAVSSERFDDDPRALGLMLSMLAVGGILASLLTARLASRGRPEVTMVVAASVWGLALAGFGAVQAPAATLAFLVLAGAADTLSVIARGTLIQLKTPDGLLGRASAVEGIIGTAGPGLGNTRAGAVATLTSPAVAALTGGLACTSAVLALAVRGRRPSNPPLASQRADEAPGSAARATASSA